MKKSRACWFAKQHKKGWRLALAFEDENLWISKVWFGSEKDIEKAIKSHIVFSYRDPHRVTRKNQIRKK